MSKAVIYKFMEIVIYDNSALAIYKSNDKHTHVIPFCENSYSPVFCSYSEQHYLPYKVGKSIDGSIVNIDYSYMNLSIFLVELVWIVSTIAMIYFLIDIRINFIR